MNTLADIDSIVYALSPSLVDAEPDVTILRVIHGAMQWPSADKPR